MSHSFLQSAYTGASAALVALSVSYAAHAGADAPATLKPLTERVAVAGQITPEQLSALKARGFSAIVALRPDGEAPDQPAAAQMQAAAHGQGMRFTYIPVAPGSIPDAAVTALGQALADSSGKALIYCRSGSRAARTWSLAEASRAQGAELDDILASVKASGQSAHDLREALAQRISARPVSR